MRLCVDEDNIACTSFFQFVVSDNVVCGDEVLLVKYFDISVRLRVSSSLDPQLVSQCLLVQLPKHF